MRSNRTNRTIFTSWNGRLPSGLTGVFLGNRLALVILSCYTGEIYIVLMFFEPSHLLPCYGAPAWPWDFREPRGRHWKRISLPAGVALHCKGKPAGKLRLFFARESCPPGIFREALFLGTFKKGLTVWGGMRASWQRGLSSPFCFSSCRLRAGGSAVLCSAG